MAAAEMPCVAASFLKSASQRSKLPVLRQLAFWAEAVAGAKAKRPAMRPAIRPMIRILIAAPAPSVRARTLLRIGLSAVVDDSVIVEGLDCHCRNASPQALLADLAASRLS